jgi:hypothetical protein
MAVTETHVAPFILTHPLILLGDNATGVEVQCMANQVQATADQDDTTTETFCGSYTSYKAEVWTITLTALQSFGDDGLETLVRPLVGQVIPFTIVPEADDAISVDNPAMWGTARVKVFSFLDANVGEASSFDLVLAVQGQPHFDPPDTTPADQVPGVVTLSTPASAPPEGE